LRKEEAGTVFSIFRLSFHVYDYNNSQLHPCAAVAAGGGGGWMDDTWIRGCVGAWRMLGGWMDGETSYTLLLMYQTRR